MILIKKDDVGLLHSQIKLTLLGHREDLFCPILQPARPGDSLDGSVPLDLYFRVLFPATDVHGHVIKGDLLFQELVHLALDRVLVTRLDERRGVVDAGHRVEIFMLA